jgi:hypothetical protein
LARHKAHDRAPAALDRESSGPLNRRGARDGDRAAFGPPFLFGTTRELQIASNNSKLDPWIG